MSDLVQRVRLRLTRQRLLPADGRLLVAVSGGLDSMVLLNVLREISSADGLDLSVAHVNHQLRGKESRADEAFVIESARQMGLAVQVGKLEVRAAMNRTGTSLEMAARRLRHEFLAKTARKLKITAIALAHHADDQVELVLLRLLRGAGGEGLGGMAESDASPVDPTIRLIRPLLDVSKAELQDFAKAQGIRFRTDASNADTTILRNRIRHELRPHLEQHFNPALGSVLSRTAEIVGAEADFVAGAAVGWLKAKRRSRFDRLHLAVQRAVLRRQLWQVGFRGDFELVERLRSSTDWVVMSPTVAIRRSEAGKIERQLRSGKSLSFDPSEQRLVFQRGLQSIQHGALVIDYESKRRGAGVTQFVPRLGCEQFDAAAIGTVIGLRFWRPGDRFRPLGFARATKLQDLFVNRKVPAVQRRALVVATTASGEIFWVEGLPPGERFKVTPSTVRILSWLPRRS